MAASAAAAIVIKEKHIVEAYRFAGATSPDHAATPASLGVHERIAFRKLVGHAVLRETQPGMYYLDEPSWAALGNMRRRITTVLMTAAIIIILIALFFQRAGRS